METGSVKLKPKDFASDQDVKWCPGCGDYAVLNAVQRTFSELNLAKEDVVIVSGIGCSSRFPYYMDTYGFHTIHGRAAAVATGVKLANPNLHVWVASGDGDSLAIGGNHFIHLVRRNINLTLIIFNNEIYGLTKGQHSPTSKKGIITKSAPFGSLENSFNTGSLTIGAKGTFFARVPDTDVKLMTRVFMEAAQHEGTSVVEVLQNCVIFNDGTHEQITAKEHRDDRQLILEHGRPMRFGVNGNKGIRLNGLKPEVVTLGENGITENNLLVHDAMEESPLMHLLLCNLTLPDFPVPLGVIRNTKDSVFDKDFHRQLEEIYQKKTFSSVDEMMFDLNTFVVK